MDRFTRIENTVLEKLSQINLSGSALACALVLLRKTNGFNKEKDGISLSQFVKLVNRSKPTIVKALKELQLVKICLLVKKGKSLKSFNIYTFNKNVEEWKLVKKSKLVKNITQTSKVLETQLVKKSLHTKETITKESISKDIGDKSPAYGNADIDRFVDGINKYLTLKLPKDGKSRRVAKNCLDLLEKHSKSGEVKEGREFMHDDKWQNANMFVAELDRVKISKGYDPQSWYKILENLKLWIANKGVLSVK